MHFSWWDVIVLIISGIVVRIKGIDVSLVVLKILWVVSFKLIDDGIWLFIIDLRIIDDGIIFLVVVGIVFKVVSGNLWLDWRNIARH